MSTQATEALATLNALGWNWHNDGVTVTVVVDGRQRQIFVPVRHLWVEFGREFKAVGAPLVGCGDFSVGGWWSSLKRSVKRVVRKAKNTVKKAVNRVKKVATTAYKKVVKPALNIAKKVINNPIVRHGIKLAAVALPVLAPVALGVEAAAQALKLVDDGVKAAKRVADAAKTGMRVLQGDRQAMAKALGVQKNMAAVVALAKRGDKSAMRQIGAFKMLAQAA